MSSPLRGSSRAAREGTIGDLFGEASASESSPRREDPASAAPDAASPGAPPHAPGPRGVTLLRGVRHWRTGERIDLGIADGMIVDARGLHPERVIDAAGAVVAPGLVDLHVHLREPGQTAKETIETGARAAAAGGFTAIACMPNTRPVLDTPEWIDWVRHRAAGAACRVHPMGAVTVGQEGKQLTEFLALKAAGAVALSDDGRPIMSAAVMRHALEYAKHAGLPIVCHEEDLTLKGDGAMNEGFTATRLGVRGIPSAAESVMVRRDVELAELTGGRVHFAHLSCAASFAALRDGKARGLAVTGETCPHYWMLTDEAVGDHDTFAKMNPPLRSESDREATLAAIVDGTVDCFATDHAPHTMDEKRQTFDLAPFGIVGLETALGLTLTGLVEPGHLSLERAIELWTDAPRRVFRLPSVSLDPGSPADLVLIDPGLPWTVDASSFASKGRNTPFDGWSLTGRAIATFRAGRPTFALAGTAAEALGSPPSA